MQINYNAQRTMEAKEFREAYKGASYENLAEEGNHIRNERLTALNGASNSIVSGMLDIAWRLNSGPGAKLASDYRLGRTFFINQTGTSFKVKMGGVMFPIDNDVAYACHPSEWLHIDQSVKAEGYNLTKCDALTWWSWSYDYEYVFLT